MPPTQDPQHYVMSLQGSIEEIAGLLARLVKTGLVLDLRPVAPCDEPSYQRCPIRIVVEDLLRQRRVAEEVGEVL